MTTILPSAAYAAYFRRPVPDGSGATGATALSNWLGIELLNVQRAIPQRFTRTVTANYTLLTTDDVVLVDATSGAITITWPDPTRAQHYTGTVKKIDATANAVTFASTIASTSTAATFDGVTSPTLVSQYDSRAYRSNGLEYYQTVEGVTAIFSGSVPAANVTHGTFGSATSDANSYKFAEGVIFGQNNKPTVITGNEPAVSAVTIYGDNTTTGVVTLRLINIAAQSALSLARVNGTVASPTAILSADSLGNVQFRGYDGSATALAPSGLLVSTATQNWSSTAHGAKMAFSTVPNGSTTLTTALTLDQDQSATFAGAGTFSGNMTAGNAFLAASGQYHIRNAANTGDISFVANSGADVIAIDSSAFGVSFGGNITLKTAAALIISGATSTAIMDSTNSFQNLLVTNAGNVTVRGTLGVTSDFSVATNKLVVAASSGNTAVAGTFTSTGFLWAKGIAEIDGLVGLGGGATTGVGVNISSVLTGNNGSIGVAVIPSITANANGDTTTAVLVSPTFSAGGHTGVLCIALDIGAVTVGATNYAIRTAAGLVKLSGNVGIGGTPTATSPLNITSLPTSAVGLATGDIYSLAGTLHVA